MVKLLKTRDDYDKAIRSAGDKLVVIDFFATWCSPCKQIAPGIEKLASEMVDKIVFVKVDIDDDTMDELTQEFKVKSVPTFVFLKNGKVVDQFSGADKAKLVKTIQNITSK